MLHHNMSDLVTHSSILTLLSCLINYIYLGCKLHNLLDAPPLQSQPCLNELIKIEQKVAATRKATLNYFSALGIISLVVLVHLVLVYCFLSVLGKFSLNIEFLFHLFRPKKRQKKDKKPRSGRRQPDNSYIDTIDYSSLSFFIKIVIV